MAINLNPQEKQILSRIERKLKFLSADDKSSYYLGKNIPVRVAQAVAQRYQEYSWNGRLSGIIIGYSKGDCYYRRLPRDF